MQLPAAGLLKKLPESPSNVLEWRYRSGARVMKNHCIQRRSKHQNDQAACGARNQPDPSFVNIPRQGCNEVFADMSVNGFFLGGGHRLVYYCYLGFVDSLWLPLYMAMA